MKKICVITTSRADYGLLYSLIQKIHSSLVIKLQLIVSGSHLSPRHGMTVNQIHEDGFLVDAEVPIIQDADSELDISVAFSLGITGFANAYKKLSPDMVLILGDRYEILAAAISATIANIPIIHLHGGEITRGAYDDAFRHSITKMAHLHFVAAKPYLDRVIQLGENSENVYCVGGLGVDAIQTISLLSRQELAEELKIELKGKLLLVTFHPVTLEKLQNQVQISSLLEALSEFSKNKIHDSTIIFTMPNADTEGLKISRQIDAFVKKNKNAYFFTSLGQQRYYSCLNQFDAVIGNSSSGLLEAPSFKIPSVNIGSRQEGRLKAPSIIDCDTSTIQILEAIKLALSKHFRHQIKNVKNPYGDGGASQKIVNILENIKISGIQNKKFYDNF